MSIGEVHLGNDESIMLTVGEFFKNGEQQPSHRTPKQETTVFAGSKLSVPLSSPRSLFFFYTFIHFFLRTTEVELPHFGGRFPILKGKNRVPSFEKPDFRRCLPVAKTTCNHEKVAQSLF